jgi:hypothetical protein
MANFPSERQIVERLRELFGERPEYTFSALMQFIKPQSPALLALILDDLAKQGAIVRVFRLESPFTHSGLQEFKSILDVPDGYYDLDSDEVFDVHRENVLPLFKRAEP